MAGRLTFVMVTGAVPGLGKSTLARRLAVELGACLFAEEDIRDDDAFSDVMLAFARDGRVGTDVLLDAAERFARAAEPGTHVLDALFPHLPSLLVWGHDDDAIAGFLARLRQALDGVALVQLHLVGDIDRAVDRAAVREGDDWLAPYARKYGVEGRNALVQLLAEHDRRSRAVLTDAPWPVLFVDGR